MQLSIKPRLKLGSLGITRDMQNGVRYAPRITAVSPPPTIAPTATVTATQPDYTGGTLWRYTEPKISPPASFYEQTVSLPEWEPQLRPGDPGYVSFPAEIPEQFRYSKEQLMDMLARGASETYQRTGETESGLPLELELEQLSRELDASKQYAVNAEGEIVALEPEPTAGAGLMWAAAAAAAFFLFGG